MQEKPEKRFAIIDIGSNSIRYMTEASPEKTTVTTRLGFRLAQTGRLDAERMADSVRVITEMAEAARAGGFTPLAYATSAVRDCANRSEFLKMLYESAGLIPDVLSGEREAEYAYAAASNGGGLIDIGGASMQLVTACFKRSYPVGCVRGRDIALSATGREDCDDHYEEQREALRAHIERLTEAALPDKKDFLPCVGVGGTITTLGALAKGLDTFSKKDVDGTVLTRETLEQLINTLSVMGKKRSALPLLRVRHDVILYGAAILAEAMDLMGVPALTVSTRDGQDGYLDAAKRGEVGEMPVPEEWKSENTEQTEKTEKKMRLVIASNNKNKIREIREILGHRFDEVLSQREAGLDLDVVEDADSFLGNARKKAVEASLLLPGDTVLADDSGLCVDALGGAPGVYSARFAGEHDDAANRRKLLDEMKDVPDGERGAHFACAMVLAKDGKSFIEAVGRADGSIMHEERGTNGFGYDSLFFYEPYGLSFAELDAERKNAVSHRHNALMMVLAALEENE